jgi:hypothetical protein
VRVEVETALGKGLPVIPILVGRTSMPKTEQLPDSLKNFAHRHAARVDEGTDFDHHLGLLIQAMDGILTKVVATVPVPPREPPKVKMPTGKGLAVSPAEREPSPSSIENAERLNGDKDSEKQWDFFIAYDGADSGIAESLYERLASNFHVFLDTRSLLPGDDRDLALATAQSRSRITVVLISSNTTTAYYKEISAAIALARDDVQNHRVIPVFIDDNARENSAIPSGLRRRHSILISSSGGLEGAAQHLTRALAPTLAMSSTQILRRHENRSVVEVGLRLVPTNEFQCSLSLGASRKSYSIIADYEEQKFRTLRQILDNLLIGDSFEMQHSSNVHWSAIRFTIGNSNYRKLDLFPATWKAAFRILSDPARLARFQPTGEEIEKMGRHRRDYMSNDQNYWHDRLMHPPERGDLNNAFLREDLGISNLCFDGNGLTTGTIRSRIFIVKNVPVSTLDSHVIPMDFPADGKILM